MQNLNKVLEVKDLVKEYIDGDKKIRVIDNLNLSIDSGEMVAIVGRSGSGKSTLLHLLGALDNQTSGEILVDGINISELSSNRKANFRNQKIGFIYQFHHLLSDFNAIENVMLPLLIGGIGKKQAYQQALELLVEVGLEKRIEHNPDRLSGGERARVAIARALINKPKLILADEPTGSLDEKTTLDIFSLLKRINQEENTTILTVTHDINLANKFSRKMLMQNYNLSDISAINENN